MRFSIALDKASVVLSQCLSLLRSHCQLELFSSAPRHHTDTVIPFRNATSCVCVCPCQESWNSCVLILYLSGSGPHSDILVLHLDGNHLVRKMLKKECLEETERGKDDFRADAGFLQQGLY